MRNKSLSWLGLSVALALATPVAAQVAPEPWLLEQIRLGESLHRDDLVQESLHRLALIAPDHPQLMMSRLRLSLRQENPAEARLQFERLARLAPDSDAYLQAKLAMYLLTESGSRQLQQARLLAAGGRLEDARQAYQALFAEGQPGLELAVEYWTLVARISGQQALAIARLQELESHYPGDAAVRLNLARLLLNAGQFRQGFSLLQDMTKESLTRNQAAEFWLERIRALPVGEASVAQLRHFLDSVGGELAVPARELLEQQQTLLADPVFQARLRGLALVAQGDGEGAARWLRRALAAHPGDAQLLGALGQAYGQQGDRDRAITLLEQAVRADPDSGERSKWLSLLQTHRYWKLIQQGNQAIEAQAFDEAEQLFRRASRQDSNDSYAWVGLGEVALARREDGEAERHFQQALQKEPANSSAIRGLVTLYSRRSPERASLYLEQLTVRQRQSLGDEWGRLRASLLQQQAEALAQRQEWQAAAGLLEQARPLVPDDVWLHYRLAQYLLQAGESERADAVMAEQARRRPDDVQQVYAHALYLSSRGRDEQALAHLTRLPAAHWSSDMTELAQRLELERRLAQARALREQGNEREAIDFLLGQPAATRIDLVLADWALERGEADAALDGFRKVLASEPGLVDARLGEIEALLALRRRHEAKSALQSLSGQQELSLNETRRIANAWAGMGESDEAADWFRRAAPLAHEQAPSMESAWLLRDKARFSRQQGRSPQALDDYARAMSAAGLAAPADNEAFTRATREQPEDDWLLRSIRSDAADLYRHMDTTITFNQEYWGSSGTGGYSDLGAHTSMLELATPVSGGRAFFRTDMVHMDAGRFEGDTYNETFGTCREAGCSGDHHQTATGASVALGWEGERWRGDLGTTPLGFEVVDWVGGLDYSGDWRQLGWTLTASRRPLSNSLLAFAGTRDPNTGLVWGGVRATGLNLSLSYDQGGAHGVWGNLGSAALTGEHVEDNHRFQLMGGYYYKLVNEAHRRVSVGVNSMWWQYRKDLSGYSLGQGGYYSPQQYLSMGVPVSYRERTDNWSWELGGSVSMSRSTTDDQARYPLSGLVPDDLPDRNAIGLGGSSNGFGYTLRALVERRLDSHWSIGGGFSIQQARDYTPSNGLLYLRYSFGGWQGNLDMPPLPLTPYAEFR
ncbi:cellulose synthase complex outer membrane protein BcsC [Zobellella sp. DQSA1]|uniref:cellulose synthase complex outer membrane protein BcsC n=1 Tax=Zobellella sp. DQSA1 TaxID=3342386 RepID=UPI0035C12C6A